VSVAKDIIDTSKEKSEQTNTPSFWPPYRRYWMKMKKPRITAENE
jgi:hypothetical protein